MDDMAAWQITKKLLLSYKTFMPDTPAALNRGL